MDEGGKKNIRFLWKWMKYVMIPPMLIWLWYHELIFEFFGNRRWMLFVIGAGLFNPIMDTLEHHFSTSIFKNLNPKFWNPLISSDSAYRIGGYKIDAWHLSKSAMIICWALALRFSLGNADWIDFCFIGYFYNITFSLFYDIILRRK